MADVCEFCSGDHPVALHDIGGISIRTCPEVPRGHLYEHDEPDAAPPGKLHRLDEGPTSRAQEAPDA